MGSAASGARRMAAQLGEGFAAIAGSRYLLTLAAYLLLSTATSSLLYFLKAAVLAGAAPDAGGRMALVAGINSTSAGIIAVLQVRIGALPAKPNLFCPDGLGSVRAHGAGCCSGSIVRWYKIGVQTETVYTLLSTSGDFKAFRRVSVLGTARSCKVTCGLNAERRTPAWQLCATGRLLRRMGLERALCASPAVSAALLAAIAASPTAAVVGLGEALRKVRGGRACLGSACVDACNPQL